MDIFLYCLAMMLNGNMTGSLPRSLTISGTYLGFKPSQPCSWRLELLMGTTVQGCHLLVSLVPTVITSMAVPFVPVRECTCAIYRILLASKLINQSQVEWRNGSALLSGYKHEQSCSPAGKGSGFESQFDRDTFALFCSAWWVGGELILFISFFTFASFGTFIPSSNLPYLLQ